MFKKNVLLGSLIAGAFLLPAVANAAVQGICSKCHTMHNSQNGAAVVAGGPFNKLLSGGGGTCVGCHAEAGVTNDAGTGLGNNAMAAPQVTQSGANGTSFLTGGYFNATAASVHDASGFGGGAVLVSAAPGANGVRITEADGTISPLNLSCENCHDAGGHHKPNAYRQIKNVTTTNNTPAPNYGVQASFPGDRAAAAYNATEMNTFCASCHGGFHGANQKDAAGTAAGTWIRHPTDISMANPAVAGSAPSIVAGYDNTVDNKVVPVGTNGTNIDVVMCLSCHVPHGGPNADLLSFDYNTAQAGAGGATTGCETCHSYGTGM